MLHSPTIIAIAAGLLLGATGIYRALVPSGIAGIIDSCTDFVSAPTGAVILLALGYDLVFREIHWMQVGKVVCSRIVIMALMRILAGLIVRGIGMGDGLDAALNVMFILPAPFVLPVFRDRPEQRSYISSSISVMMIMTVVGFIVLAALQ